MADAKAAGFSAAFLRDGIITQRTHNALAFYARRRCRIKPACGWWGSNPQGTISWDIDTSGIGLSRDVCEETREQEHFVVVSD